MAASLRQIEIVRLLNESFFFGALNTPLENLTRSITFYFFSFLTLTYNHPHHANDQINIRTLLKIRRTLMLSISDALEYVHATVFFYIFKNL